MCRLFPAMSETLGISSLPAGGDESSQRAVLPLLIKRGGSKGWDQRAEVARAFFWKVTDPMSLQDWLRSGGDISNVLTELTKLKGQKETIHTRHVHT